MAKGRAVPMRVYKAMVAETLKDALAGHVSRDAAVIEPRERPVNRKKDTETQETPRKKRGRPKIRRGATQRAYLR